MSYSDKLTLIATATATGADGVSRKSGETSREIFCRVRSVGASEFFKAGASGLRASWQFSVHPDEYRGEKTVEYRGKRYTVYRVYQASLRPMELYAGVRAGV